MITFLTFFSKIGNLDFLKRQLRLLSMKKFAFLRALVFESILPTYYCILGVS